MASVSGPYVLQVNQTAGSSDPDADLKQSPLWPLQSALRAGFVSALNNTATTPEQIARVTTPRNEVETEFALWRSYQSLTKLRATIEQLLDPNYLDLADDPALASLQTQLLAVPNWNDTLPS